MRQILIKIDVDDPDICGNCQALGYVDFYGTGKFENPSCGVFNEDLGQAPKGGAYRCKSCMDAERLSNGIFEAGEE